MKKKLATCLTLVLLTLTTAVTSAQQLTQLQGRVWLNDTLPAAYATLYLPQYGIGTVTDDQGNYWMDNIPVGPSVTLEYAFLGYKTAQVKLALTQPNHKYAHDQRLEEQIIALSEVYLTPNGEDPVTYICRKVTEQSKENRKRLTDYTAVVDAYAIARDMDLLPKLLPGLIWKPLRATVRAERRGAMLDYITEHESIDVHYTYTQTKSNGKLQTSKPNIVSAKPAIPAKAQEQLDKYDDLFNMLYEENLKFKAKSAVKDGWKLKGIVEEQGRDVDVLTRTVVKDKEKTEYTLYVIEDLWTILRYEEKSGGGLERYECRDIGGGIYMPFSLISQPIPMDFDAEFDEMFQINDSILALTGASSLEEVNIKPKGMMNKIKVKMMMSILKRVESVRKEGRTYRPLFDCPFTIKYSNVKVNAK